MARLWKVTLNDRFCKQKGGRVPVPIKWIFFDVGSTLVDETAAYDHRAREMLQGTEISFREFDSKRKELAARGFDGNSEAIKFFGLKKTPWHSEDEVLFPDTAETLAELKRRGYHLGIVANQPLGTEKRLDTRGILKYFDVIAASAEMGVAKPDARIFQSALEMARCQPSEAVMVGDRLDNDMIPAKSLGMKTAWIRKGTAIYQDRACGEKTADWIVNSLGDLLNIFMG